MIYLSLTFQLNTKQFFSNGEWVDTLLEHIIKFKSIIEKDFQVERCVTGYKSLLIEIKNKIKSVNYWKNI